MARIVAYLENDSSQAHVFGVQPSDGDVKRLADEMNTLSLRGKVFIQESEEAGKENARAFSLGRDGCDLCELGPILLLPE